VCVCVCPVRNGQCLTCQELDSSAKKDILEQLLISAAQSVGTWLQYCGWKERATPPVGCRTKSQQANMSAAQTPPGGGAVAAAAEAWGPSTTVDDLALLLQQPIVSGHTTHYMPVQGFLKLPWIGTEFCCAAVSPSTSHSWQLNAYKTEMLTYTWYLCLILRHPQSNFFQNKFTGALKNKIKFPYRSWTFVSILYVELKTSKYVRYKTLMPKLKKWSPCNDLSLIIFNVFSLLKRYLLNNCFRHYSINHCHKSICKISENQIYLLTFLAVCTHPNKEKLMMRVIISKICGISCCCLCFLSEEYG